MSNKNLDELEQAINENKKDYVSVSFHGCSNAKKQKEFI